MLYNFAALAVVIDPLGTAALFAALSHGASPDERRRMALRGTVLAGLIILGFAILGALLLHALDITLAAFRIAGGIFLFLLATDMVFARHSGLRATTADEEREASHRHDISVFPLAIPLLAGPGALTTIVLLMAKAGDSVAAHSAVIAVLAIVMLATLGLLLAAPRLVRVLGVTGTNVVSRLLGILLGALAVQFVLDGLRESLLAR